jgi:2'-5' RNA ligase
VLLPVPPPFGRQLDQYRHSLSGRAPETPAHITLVPPTEVDASAMPSVLAHLEQAAAESAQFEVRLRGTATFRPVSPVVFVAVVAGISGCERLSARVRAGPLHSTPSFPYHPHVTIAHGLSDDLLDRAFEAQAGFDASWTVSSLTLYEHSARSGWVAVRELALSG